MNGANLFFGQLFLLVNEATVTRYKSDLADEIEPVIAELIERAQQGLSALEKKEHSLQTKVKFHITYVYEPRISFLSYHFILGCSIEASKYCWSWSCPQT